MTNRAVLATHVLQPVDPPIHAHARSCGDLLPFDPGAGLVDVLVKRVHVEFQVRDGVRPADGDETGHLEHQWVLELLVLPFRYGEDDPPSVSFSCS